MKLPQLAVLMALSVPVAAIATTPDVTQPAPTTAVEQAGQGGYLGVVLQPVPPPLRAQLGGVLPAGQGVMVRDVADDSPAANAGLQPFDIIVAYDDQKLFSADQLANLVRSDAPNKGVSLQLVRGGAAAKLDVTLGKSAEDDNENAQAQLPWPPMWRHPMGPYSHPSVPPEQAQSGNWESFDSLSLEKRDDGSYQASIQYLDANGQLSKRQFTGSRDEIRDQVKQQNDVPAFERGQLLDALSARDDIGPHMGPFARHMFMPLWMDPRFNL